MSDFKNKHLDNLWIKLLPYIGGTGATSEIVKIVELFRECDMAIEDEADDCEHWRTMYGNACKKIDQLKEGIRLRERIIDKFRTTKDAAEKERDEYKSQFESLCNFLGKWRDPKARDNFEDPQKLKELKDENASLKESLDVLKKSNEALLSANMDLARAKHKLEGSLSYTMIQQLEARVEELTGEKKHLEKDLDDAKKQLKCFTQSRDNWRSRAKHAEEEVEELKKKLDFQQKIDDLKSRLNSVYGVCGAGYEQGQTDLWNMLQNVNDAKPWDIASFYPDVTCMDDILSWDREDFLDAYKEWQEEKEKKRLDHMRDYLKRFCKGRLCCNCPLYTDEFMCGRVKPFSGISDEELERYYEKVRDC